MTENWNSRLERKNGLLPLKFEDESHEMISQPRAARSSKGRFGSWNARNQIRLMCYLESCREDSKMRNGSDAQWVEKKGGVNI